MSNVYDNNHFKYGINQWTGEPNKPVFYNLEMKKKLWEAGRKLWPDRAKSRPSDLAGSGIFEQLRLA